MVFFNKTSVHKDTSSPWIDKCIYWEELGDTSSFERNREVQQSFIDIKGAHGRI